MDLFDYVNSVNNSNKDIWEPGVSDSEYKPFLVNKAISLCRETVMHAQEMNQRFHISNRMQYDFYRMAIQPKMRRKVDWNKKKDENILFLKQLYNVSYKTAIAYSNLLNNDDLEELKSLSCKGGLGNAK